MAAGPPLLQLLEDKDAVTRHNVIMTMDGIGLQGKDIVKALAIGAQAVCVFVNDVLNREVVEGLAGSGVGLIALRCAGFNNVDLTAAKELGLIVTRVPSY